MLTQQAQDGNFNLGTREPWQVFEQERSTGLAANHSNLFCCEESCGRCKMNQGIREVRLTQDNGTSRGVRENQTDSN